MRPATRGEAISAIIGLLTDVLTCRCAASPYRQVIMPRSIAFDAEQKLHAAMLLFWRKGYEATSLADLVAELEINRFSIYNTFGDKQALFQKVLAHYRRNVFAGTLAPLVPPERGLVCLRDYFTALGRRLRSPRAGALGCLIQNTALQGCALDPDCAQQVRATLSALQSRFAAVLRAGLELGELPAGHNIDTCAVFLMAQVQGMIIARKVVGVQAMQACLDYMLTEFDRWENAAAAGA